MENIERAQISEIFLSKVIIGLTGRNASGKGTVAEILKQKGFIYHSLSDSLRDELKDLGEDETRENLINVGNRLRIEGGPSVLADKMIPKLLPEEYHIVDSIRNPFEVESLKKNISSHKFYLLSVDADSRLRYERLRSRGRVGDSASWEEFVEQERKEENNSDPNKQQLSKTISKADFVIDNCKTINELESKIEKLLIKL